MSDDLPPHPDCRWIDSLDAARALFAPIAGGTREIAAFAYLDPEWRLLGMRHTPLGGERWVELPVRAVAADALAFDAARVVMAHNHPSGDPAPSTADVAATRRLARALAALGIRLSDHLVFAGDAWSSFRAMGLL